MMIPPDVVMAVYRRDAHHDVSLKVDCVCCTSLQTHSICDEGATMIWSMTNALMWPQ